MICKKIKKFQRFFLPSREILNRRNLKSTKLPWVKCHIRSKTWPFTSNYLQGAGNFVFKQSGGAPSLEGEWWEFAQNTSNQRADGGSSRPAHAVNNGSWWATISTSVVVKREKSLDAWKNIPVVSRTYTANQTLQFKHSLDFEIFPQPQRSMWVKAVKLIYVIK